MGGGTLGEKNKEGGTERRKGGREAGERERGTDIDLDTVHSNCVPAFPVAMQEPPHLSSSLLVLGVMYPLNLKLLLTGDSSTEHPVCVHRVTGIQSKVDMPGLQPVGLRSLSLCGFGRLESASEPSHCVFIPPPSTPSPTRIPPTSTAHSELLDLPLVLYQ